MATYFKPPPVRSTATATQPSAESSRASPYQLSVEVDQRSVYIFPVPSSLPASPGGSSLFSVPSDLSENLTESSGRSRNSSISSHFTETTRSRTGSLHRLTSVGEHDEAVFSPVGDATLEPEVEVWEWTEGESDDLPNEDTSWAFESEGDIEHQRLVRRLPLSRSQVETLPNAVYEPLSSYRTRTQSSSSSLSSARTPRYTPHPRVRVPILSLIASLLSIDLDDSALRLLTYSTSDSVLFPGQSSLLDSHASASSIPGAEFLQADDPHVGGTAEEQRPHGILRLLTGNSTSNSVREGLAVVCETPSALANPFALPNLGSIANVCGLVADVWVHSGQAWRELRGSKETQSR